MPIEVGDASTWKGFVGLEVGHAGTWKAATVVSVGDAGTWKEAFAPSSASFDPEAGLTLTQTDAQGAVDATIDPYINDNIVFAADAVIPVSPAEGVLYEKGGGGRGLILCVRDSGATLRLRGGDGANPPNASNTVILDVPISDPDVPNDGLEHTIVWEARTDPQPARLRLWIDGVFLGEAFTADNTDFENGQWAGTGGGGFATGAGANVGGEPNGAWDGAVNGDLRVYAGQLVDYPPGVTAAEIIALGPQAFYDFADDASVFLERTGASATTQAGIGSEIGTVLDLSGNAYHMVADSDPQRPIRTQDGNGKIYASADGTDDYLSVSGLPGAQGSMYMCVGLRTAAVQQSGNPRLVSGITTGGTDFDTVTGAAFIRSGGGGWGTQHDNVSNQPFGPGNDVACVIEVRITGTTFTLNLNGGADQDQAHTNPSNLDVEVLRMFANALYNGEWSDDGIYTLVAFSGIPSAGDRDLVREYVAQQAGVTLP